MGCDFPEHHGKSGFDWWLVLALAAVVGVFAGLYVVWEALGEPVAVSTVVAGLILVGVLFGVVRAVVGSVRATSGRRGGGLSASASPGNVLSDRVAPDVPAPAVDELAARRAQRRVA